MPRPFPVTRFEHREDFVTADLLKRATLESICSAPEVTQKRTQSLSRREWFVSLAKTGYSASPLSTLEVDMSAPQTLKKVVVNGNRYYQSSKDPTKLYPSVTTVLSAAVPKPGLSNWQRRFTLDAFKRKLISSSTTYHTPGTKLKSCFLSWPREIRLLMPFCSFYRFG